MFLGLFSLIWLPPLFCDEERYCYMPTLLLRWLERNEVLVSTPLAACPFEVKEGDLIIGAVVLRSKNFYALISLPGNSSW